MSTNRIPTIEILSRTALLEFLTQNPPTFIFENVQEVSNPIGKQHNYKLTTRISNEIFQDIIVCYAEAFYDVTNTKELYKQSWLADKLSKKIKWYKGIICP